MPDYLYGDRPLPEIWAEQEEERRRSARLDPKLRPIIAQWTAADRQPPAFLTVSYRAYLRARAEGKPFEEAVKHLDSAELPHEARRWRVTYQRTPPDAPGWLRAMYRDYSESCWAELRSRRR